MRISGTGHVLVGQSSTLTAGSGNTVTGFSIRNDGGFYASSSSGGTINANTNTDGEIALFRKDGSTVGVIGTVSSELFIGTGSSGFYFDASNTSIKPRNVSSGTGSAADGTIDLGGTGNRFKDAHFSGTVNSGGLTVDGGTAYKKLISTFPSTYKTNLQVGQQAHISNDAITDTLSIENTGTAGATNIQFSTAGSERMRIDSSGNLLVGTTSTALHTQSSNTGSRLLPSGAIHTAVSSDVHFMNRLSTDGDIIRFQKDGTTVGSIGSTSSRLRIMTPDQQAYVFLNYGAADSANRLWLNGSLLPWDNASYDIGSSTTKFKDLYLSGGVFLGGTGSANKLDDYEEGTFTPSWTNASSATYNTQIGKYTKIGNVVFYYIRLDSSSLTFTSAPAIQGLPFTSNNTANLYSNAYTFPTIGFEYFGDGGIIGQVPFNDTKVQLYYLTNGTGGNYNVVDASSMSEGTQVVINVSGHYYI
jgi:hypothetical protein